MHEHVFILSPDITANYPEVWGDEAKREAEAIARLNELKSRGVDSIVDLTVIGMGRYIPRIERIAAATDINIVVATGVYTYNDVPMYFHFTGPGGALGDSEPMVDMFVRDIEAGHRRHGHQGRDPQVRHRRARRHSRCGAGAAGRRQGAPPHRRADLDSYARCDPTGARAAAHLRRRGRRSGQGGDRPFRRHHRPRLPRGAHRQRLLHRAWTGSVSTSSCRSRTE